MSTQSDRSATGAVTDVLRHDLLASVVVFLVALPLCMGIAIASGASVAAGLVTGIVGGLVVGLLAGSPLQVSGPAAGLTVIVYEAIQTYGIDMLGLIVLLAGMIQFAAGTARLAQWFRAVSPAVIKGMLTGIGVLIFASQFHVMVDDKPKGSGLANLASIPEAIHKGFSIPRLTTREERQLRTRALKQVGELHREQADLAARMAERLPDHASPETIARRSEEQLAGDRAAVLSFAERQSALATEMRELASQVQDLPKSEQGENLRRLRSAADEAVASLEAAAVAIDAGDPRAALEAQRGAVSALAGLLDRMKTHGIAAQLGVLTILLILAWQGLAPRKFKVIPAPLVAVLITTTVAAAASLPVLFVEVPDNPLAELHFLSLRTLYDAPWPGILQAAVVIAVVASAETLLCAVAVDQLHTGPRTKFDKELVAQGLGNMTCGLLGALPMTGVIVRSAANVQAGARSRWSAVLHGFWLLIFVVWLSFLLRMVPTSALAAILVYTGYKLINPKQVKELLKFGKGEVFVYAVTVAVIVVEDLLAGVLTGVALSGVKLLYAFSHLRIDYTTDPEARRATLSLNGAATFLKLPLLAARLDNVPHDVELHVDMRRLTYIDHACLELLTSWARQHESTGGRLVIDWDRMHDRFNQNPGTESDSVLLRRSA
jgi:MFS superfamily sulfate permease-like transporter